MPLVLNYTMSIFITRQKGCDNVFPCIGRAILSDKINHGSINKAIIQSWDFPFPIFYDKHHESKIC